MTKTVSAVPDDVRKLAEKFAGRPIFGEVRFVAANAIADAIMADRSTRSPSVKALEWSASSPSNDYCPYDHTFADTPFGRYQIEWKSWKDYPVFTATALGEVFLNGDTLGSTKDAVQAHYEAGILSALTFTAPSVKAEPVGFVVGVATVAKGKAPETELSLFALTNLGVGRHKLYSAPPGTSPPLEAETVERCARIVDPPPLIVVTKNGKRMRNERTKLAAAIRSLSEAGE